MKTTPHADAVTRTKFKRRMISFRFDRRTIEALEQKARELGTSQSNALGVILGAHPESFYAKEDKRGNVVVR